MSVRNGSSLPFRPLVFSEGPCTFNNKLDFALAKGSSQCSVGHPIVGEGAPSCLCARYGVKASGLLPANIAITHPTKTFHNVMDPRLLPKVSLHKEPSILSSCEIPKHSTNVMAPFSRAPLNLTIALFIATLFRVWRSCRSFFPRCAWRARQSFDWTRGTPPAHTPPTPLLVWLSQSSLSDWVANGSSHCSHCSTHPSPRPPVFPPPFPLPYPLPVPISLLLSLRPAEFISLYLKGPLPPLGLPMNCQLHPLFSFSWLRLCVCVRARARVYVCMYVCMY